MFMCVLAVSAETLAQLQAEVCLGWMHWLMKSELVFWQLTHHMQTLPLPSALNLPLTMRHCWTDKHPTVGQAAA